MICFLLLCMGYVTHGTCKASPSYEMALSAWTQGDGKTIPIIKDAAYTGLTPDELNNLLPQMAKWIPMDDALKKHADPSWKTFKTNEGWTLLHNALPSTDPVLQHWDFGYKAANVIRTLSEQHLVDNQEILKFLAAGLTGPEY